MIHIILVGLDDNFIYQGWAKSSPNDIQGRLCKSLHFSGVKLSST